MLQVEVVFVDAEGIAYHEAFSVEAGTTVGAVIQRSSFSARFPEIKDMALGTFGRAIAPETLVEDGMRVEICRALCLAPMERRRLRAVKKRRSGK